MAEERGRFPFGMPATRRPPRGRENGADLFVLGVYPSALHVRWTRPDGEVVGALAVDDEPEVFWDGADADKRIATWQEAVGWSNEWGKIGAAGGNGSSGRSVVENVLVPLGVSPDRTWFTDCLPTYFVKAGKGSQGERIRSVYDEFAASHAALRPADLPKRPAPSVLVERAIRNEGAGLLGEIRRSGAARIVTLGQEAADVLAEIAELDRVQLDCGASYGTARPLAVDHQSFDWIPLTHPGNRTSRWVERHARWAADRSPATA